VKYISIVSILCAVTAWFFAMLSVDCWRDDKRFLAVVFSLVSFVLGVGGVVLWILLS
jgi:hypothetical protein